MAQDLLFSYPGQDFIHGLGFLVFSHMGPHCFLHTSALPWQHESSVFPSHLLCRPPILDFPLVIYEGTQQVMHSSFCIRYISSLKFSQIFSKTRSNFILLSLKLRAEHAGESVARGLDERREEWDLDRCTERVIWGGIE
jgi:hypothetical protein